MPELKVLNCNIFESPLLEGRKNSTSQKDFLGVTTNGVVLVNKNRKNPRLVMGGGIAKEFRDRIPGIDRTLGFMIWSSHNKKLLEKEPEYYKYDPIYLMYKDPEVPHVFTIQTKLHYKDPSPIDLIEHQLKILDIKLEWAQGMDFMFHLPMPGIGLGGLKFDEVFELIDSTIQNKSKLVLYHL